MGGPTFVISLCRWHTVCKIIQPIGIKGWWLKKCPKPCWPKRSKEKCAYIRGTQLTLSIQPTVIKHWTQKIFEFFINRKKYFDLKPEEPLKNQNKPLPLVRPRSVNFCVKYFKSLCWHSPFKGCEMLTRGRRVNIFKLKSIWWPSPFKGCSMLTRGRRMCSSRPACSCGPSRTPQRPPWSTPPLSGWGRGVPEQRGHKLLKTPYVCIANFRPPWCTPPLSGWGRGVPEQRAQTPLNSLLLYC